ncbi:hypothetical protein NN561_001548 [Cricetulus griseus]
MEQPLLSNTAPRNIPPGDPREPLPLSSDAQAPPASQGAQALPQLPASAVWPPGGGQQREAQLQEPGQAAGPWSRSPDGQAALVLGYRTPLLALQLVHIYSSTLQELHRLEHQDNLYQDITDRLCFAILYSRPKSAIPAESIVQEFLDICENVEGAIAVHCKAGLGRIGTLIGCYLMKHYRMRQLRALPSSESADQVGPQQQFLVMKQSSLCLEGDYFRQKMRGQENGPLSADLSEHLSMLMTFR